MGAPTLREVISRETSFVRRTLSQLGVHENDINDVTQEVLLAVNKGLPTFDPSLAAEPDKAIRAWLFGICERQAANLRRRSSRRSEVITSDETIDDLQSDESNTEDRWLRQEQESLVRGALARIPPERRAVVEAYDLDGVPMQEVALLLGIPVNTAWNRRRLGLLDLRSEWCRRAATRGSAPPARPRALRNGGGRAFPVVLGAPCGVCPKVR